MSKLTVALLLTIACIAGHAQTRIAVQVGELDTYTKEFNPVPGAQASNFAYQYDSKLLGMQWIDSRGNKISQLEVFTAKGSCDDFKGRPCTYYFSEKNAIKLVSNGSPSGDMIYFTPRSWIDKNIGWKSVHYQLGNEFLKFVKDNKL